MSEKLGIDSDNDSLEIREYEEVDAGYPEEAYPGALSVYKSETDVVGSIILYATRVSLKQLAMLLVGMSNSDTVRFEISVIAQGLPLGAGEGRDFVVNHWSPVLVKSYR